MENYGVLSLLPVAVVIVLVFLTKRTTRSPFWRERWWGR